MTATLGTPIQGVTLYSFTRAFHGREYDLEGLIRKVAAEGYGPGLEIIGFSSFRGFPQIEDSFAGWFRDLVDEVGLVTTSLAVNADIGIHRDRLLTQPELDRLHDAADQGGGETRLPDRPCADLDRRPTRWRRSRPIAEEHGVTLALEVHADQYASHPRILALRDRYEKVGSPFLGFTMDWGATVSGFAPSLIEAYRRRGASEELLAQGRRPLEHLLRAGSARRSGSARSALRLVHRPRRAERASRPRHRLRHQRHRPVRPRAGE